MSLAEFSPGIFTANQQGTGQGIITENYTGRLVDSSFPATAGSTYIIIYCTGLGAVTNPPASGGAASADPLSQTLTTPTVTIGGTAAVPLFSGLTPGYVGLYQVSVQVPAGSAKGSAVPVSRSAASARTQPR